MRRGLTNSPQFSSGALLSLCVIRKVLPDEPLDHAIEVRIASTKASCELVPTAFGNPHRQLSPRTDRSYLA
jgi:hypothetical protein